MSAYRLGFLLCDHNTPELMPRFGDYPAIFQRAFGEVSRAVDWQVFDATAHEFPIGDECDGYLVSGSRHGAYDDLPWIGPLAETLRRLAAGPKPVFGLCFGHQMLAEALGGQVLKAPQGWGIGVRDYVCRVPLPGMAGSIESFTVPVCHQDQVLALPPGAEVLASSGHCENFAVRFAPDVIGLQGHPEFEADFMDAIIQARREILGPELYEDARTSLQREHDNRLLKAWILRFLGVPDVD